MRNAGWEVLGELFFALLVVGVGVVLMNNDAAMRYIEWLLTIKF